jgi:hypothetical protein
MQKPKESRMRIDHVPLDGTVIGGDRLKSLLRALHRQEATAELFGLPAEK